MGRGGATVFLACGAILVGARQAELPQADVVVKGRYEGENGLRIEGVGVCSITPDQVDCWDLAGARDLALADRIRGYYLNSGYSDLGFQFGKKNRFLVFRRNPTDSRVYLQPSTAGFLSTTSSGYAGGTPHLEWGRIAVEREVAEAALMATIYLPDPEPVNIPFHRGRRASVQRWEIEIGPWQPLDSKSPPRRNVSTGAPIEGKLWSLVLGVESPAWDNSDLSYEILSRSGRPIRYVDRKGEPVSDVEYLHSLPKGRTPNPFPRPDPDAKYIHAYFTLHHPSTAGAKTVTTNVNPARIGFLSVTRTVPKRVRIEGFPLDPKD